MNSRRLLVCAALLAISAGCARNTAPEPREFVVRGEYVMHQFDGQAITVDHEQIPGFMVAMRMDFRLEDPQACPPLERGDKIEFRYLVTDRDQWIEDVRVLPDDTRLVLPHREAGRGGEP